MKGKRLNFVEQDMFRNILYNLLTLHLVMVFKGEGLFVEILLDHVYFGKHFLTSTGMLSHGYTYPLFDLHPCNEDNDEASKPYRAGIPKLLQPHT